MEKKESIEINLGDFSREQLEYLIQKSCEQDVSVSVVICDMLENFVKSTDEHYDGHLD
jgi:hypothetical protein